MNSHPGRKEKCTQCLKPILTLRITYELSAYTGSHNWSWPPSTSPLHCLFFLSSCFGHTEFAVSHTLPAASCSCALLMLFLCLECPPQFQPPDRFLFFLILSGSIISPAVFTTMPGRHRHLHFPHFVLKPPVLCLLHCNCPFPKTL
uniref:Uncharacterized protein n=1 Tax=Myotis myotis TaxID=51298 RepID=A0A7J7ZXG3_MYOMY|nr:hypothetical protein mMyoMyo1_009667 [Myotis myotis]